MKTRAFGKICEGVVCKWLEGKGYRVVARNFSVKGAEIDIIASTSDSLVFFEVKSRHAGYDVSRYGRPARAVNMIKQKHIAAAAQSFLKQYPSRKAKRFDVVEVIVDEQDTYTSFDIKHIKSAFTAR